MECPACHRSVALDALFCDECGAELKPACPGCGETNRAGAKFCKKCGAALASPPTAAAAAPPTSAQSYTPRHVTETILSSRSALEGERKQVTVLFCDVVESTRLAEQLDPEALHEVMDQALRLMAAAVHRYQGSVNQFLGDGLMALFGAPVALEDHGLRAVQAALAIRETLAGYSEQLRAERGVELRLRLGLNSGLVVVGTLGDEVRMDYTAMGDTTHLASRMQSTAEPGVILVTEATHRLVEGYVRSERVRVDVKGRSEPVTAYKIIGRRRRLRTPLELSAERGLTELVGRQRELGVLRDSLERAKAGRGQVVGIVGEPGLGKSRLLHEFRKTVHGERVTWLEGHCLAYGQATPYSPLLELLRANFGIEEHDNPLQVREKLRHGLHQIDPSLAGILPFLGEVLGLPSDSDGVKHLDAKDKRRKIFEAIRALTLAGSQRRPLVLILEDLHWIDQTSEDYLAFFSESVAGMPLLLITVHRPGYTVRWADKSYYTQISLGQLSDQEAERMVASLVGSHELPADLVRVIREKGEGNPLFVEEVTTSLLERGALVRDNGRVRWARDIAAELPTTVQDIIRARIDRLDDPIKRMVQTAAVIGRDFGLRLLAEMSETASDVPPQLETLKRLELIHETRFFPEMEYSFKHAVTQDVAYNTLLLRRRRELHGAVGRAVEALYVDQLEEQAAVLAYHYARSPEPDKGIRYALLAGDQAARLYANGEARTFYDEALRIAGSLPPSPEAQRWQIDAILKLAEVAMTGQDLERAQSELLRARALAEDLRDEARLARVLYWLGRAAYALGRFPDAIELAQRSLEIGERLDDEALTAPPVNLLGRVYWWSNYARASQLLQRNIEQMGRLGNKSEEGTTAGFTGMVLGRMGEFAQALFHADYGIRLAQEIRNPFAEAAAYNYRGTIHEQKGEWAGALADYREARRIAEGTDDVFRVLMLKFLEGQVLAGTGQAQQARALIEESLGLAQKIGTRFALAWQTAVLSACLQALGDAETARVCHDAIRVAEETGDRFAGAFAHRILAEATGSEAAVREAMRVNGEIGARPGLARSYATLAALLRAKGEREPAREALAQAVAMFREMGMAWDLERAEKALREL